MTTSFNPSTFEISFLVGDIIFNKLPPSQPLPDLTCEESDQLRLQLLTEISWPRKFGEPEDSKRERKFIDRALESLHNDDFRLGRLVLDRERRRRASGKEVDGGARRLCSRA